MAKKKKKKWPVIVIIAALLGGGGLYLHNAANSVGNAMLMSEGYTAIPAGVNELSKAISANGQIIGNSTVDVTTRLSAVVSEVNVSLGDYVNEGDVLCVFDSTEIQEEYDTLKKQIDTMEKKTTTSHEKNARDLESAKAKKARALEKAQAAINKAVKERDEAYSDYNKLVDEYNSHLNDVYGEFDIPYDFDGTNERLKVLNKQLSAYDEAVSDANDAYTDTAAQYDESIQAIQDLIDAEEFDDDQSSEKQLKKLEEQLSQCTVYAPESGIITALNVNEGTLPVSSSIMTIVNTDKTVIELMLKETDINKISEGMSAEVRSKVIPNEKFKATISRIVNVISVSGESSGYKVEVTLDEPNEKLRIGMSASVDIITTAVGEKLSVPYSGVLSDDKGAYVYVAVPNNDETDSYTAKRVDVKTGFESEFYTEITDGSINEGDLIIEEPDGGEDMPPVKDGAKIYVR